MCGHKSIGIEISKTSDSAKDLDSLGRADFDIKIIVTLKPYEVPTSRFGDIWIAKPEEVEKLLRSILNVPPTYKPYTGKPKPLTLFVKKREGVLESFREYRAEELGFPELVEDSIKFVLKVHTLGGVLTRIGYVDS